MADANLNLIYQRLHSAENYHPISAETFADWSMEAGDVVTVTREGTEYKSPVHSSTLKWYGKQQMTINSEGEEKREAITRASQKKYGRGGSAVRTAEFINRDIYSEDGHLHSSLRMTESTFSVFVENKYTQLSSGIALTSSSLAFYVNDRYKQMSSGIKLTSSSMAFYVNDRYKQMSSGLQLTSSSLAFYVNDVYSQMSSGLALTKESFKLYVQGRTSSAYIIGQINGDTSTLKIHADEIDIDGIVESLEAKDVMVRNFNAASGEFTEDLSALGDLTVAGDLQVGGYDMMIADITKSGNVLTVTKTDGTELTFNKAVSLSGGWNSGVYTVSATEGSISGTAPSTTLFDLGLGTAAKGTGNTVEATYDIGYATVVGGQQRRGGSTGKTGTLSLSVGSLLQSKTASSNGTVTPDSGYLGLSSVEVDVSASPTWGTSGFAPDTNQLPSGTKHQVDSLKTTIVNNRSNQGYVYFTITVSGTRHVYYFADNGNGWTS